MVRQAHGDCPRDARRSLGAFRVATKPEEIVGHPAREIALVARYFDRRARRSQEAETPHWPVREDPRVLALAAWTQRQRAALRRSAGARQSAGHDLPVWPGSRGLRAHPEMRRRQLGARERG